MEDQPPSSFSEILKYIDELQQKYQETVGSLARFIQEIPAELLIEADLWESTGVEGMSPDERRAFANGIRYSSTFVVNAMRARMVVDKAEVEGETFDAEDQL